MWQTIISMLLNAIVAPFVMSFLRNFDANRADNESLLVFIEQQVRRASESNEEGGIKFNGVYLDVKEFAREFGLDVKDSFINASIELAVQKVKSE